MEYILLIALIALVVTGAAIYLAGKASGKFTDAGNAVKGGPCNTDEHLVSEERGLNGAYVQCLTNDGIQSRTFWVPNQ